MKRHFTATAFVVHDGKTLLHWHRRLQQWMPPGGHLLPDEDPVTGMLREVREETGLAVEVLPGAPAFPFSYPQQLAAPAMVLIEDSADNAGAEPHQHIDLIYFCRSLDGEALRPPSPDDVLLWVSADQLERSEPLRLPNGSAHLLLEDVRLPALEAIRRERGLAAPS